MTAVTVQIAPTVPPRVPLSPAVPVATEPARARPVGTLATLGDSTPVGLGDPLPGGGWRGFPVLLADALDAPRLVNPARTGARMASVRHEQLPAVLAARPDVAVLFAGMNDTLRSDFDPVALRADCAAVVDALRGAGAHVLLLRYHDHTRVFRLPAPLRRALQARIAALNAVTEAVVSGCGDTGPGGVGGAGGRSRGARPRRAAGRLRTVGVGGGPPASVRARPPPARVGLRHPAAGCGVRGAAPGRAHVRRRP